MSVSLTHLIGLARAGDEDAVHGGQCSPAFTNCPGGTFDRSKYFGYFQNRFGEQWVFVYDPGRRVGELRGGDIGWETVVIVDGGEADVKLGKAETAWLRACWNAATGVG